MWKCYLQYLVREKKIYLFITHFVNVFTPTLMKLTNKQKSIVRPLAHRHCLFVLWKIKHQKHSLSAGCGARASPRDVILLRRKQMTLQRAARLSSSSSRRVWFEKEREQERNNVQKERAKREGEQEDTEKERVLW